MKSIYSEFVLCMLLFAGCNDPIESKIKKDLNSRFTEFVIVEIKPDSTNLNYAKDLFRSLRIQVASTNRKIIDLLSKATVTKDKRQLEKYYQEIQMLDSTMTSKMQKFEDLRFDRSEPCFYVKYSRPKDGEKIPYEEYYYFNDNNGDVLHRPVEWSEFASELKYDEIIQEALKYSSEIMDLEFAIKYR